jgi:hypothetical protein
MIIIEELVGTQSHQADDKTTQRHPGKDIVKLTTSGVSRVV